MPTSLFLDLLYESSKSDNAEIISFLLRSDFNNLQIPVKFDRPAGRSFKEENSSIFLITS